ncbi:MAG: nucleotidyltransferase domain-containing protein [Pseudonocardiaceae bacterium]
MLLDRPMQVVTPTVDGDILAVLARGDVALTPGELQRRMERYSISGIRKALIRLTEQGTITTETRAHATTYQLNRRHLAADAIVALANQRQEFITRLSSALDNFSPAPGYAALFGSAARGEMHADSDIDLFLVRPDDIADGLRDSWDDAVAGLIQDSTAWTGNDTRVLEMERSEVRNALVHGDPVLDSILEDGIRLLGPRSFWRRVVNETGSKSAGSARAS